MFYTISSSNQLSIQAYLLEYNLGHRFSYGNNITLMQEGDGSINLYFG
jgi:hypothetical protein